MNTTTKDKNKILIVNADTDMFRLLSDKTDKDRYILLSAKSQNEALKNLIDETIQLVIIVDNEITGCGETVKKIKRAFPWIEILIITDHNKSSSMNLLKAANYDILTKEFSNEEINMMIDKAIKHNTMRRELITLRQQIAMNYGFDNIIGISEPMLKLKETIRRIAPTEISIMLAGAPGTGKELIARTIHLHSLRRKNKFTLIDCASISEEQFEKELFGISVSHNEADKKISNGLLREANGGTVYFNNVDKIPLSVQPRLINFLQNYILNPSCDSKPIKVDVRVISASEKDITRLIDKDMFSPELFYQLSVIPIQVPELADRSEDIELLIDYILRKRSFEMNRQSISISRKAMELLVSHQWTSNVRELENTLKRAIVLCRDNTIEEYDIISIISNNRTYSPSNPLPKTILKRKEGLLDENQRSIIIKALSEHNWNFTQTAQELGIGR
ncbi:MAG: sigma-54-dependent transcriptional regulator, partial [Candidatus Zixiibacteriota bacterium]